MCPEGPTQRILDPGRHRACQLVPGEHPLGPPAQLLPPTPPSSSPHPTHVQFIPTYLDGPDVSAWTVFSDIWNGIVEELREVDLISNAERDNLIFVHLDADASVKIVRGMRPFLLPVFFYGGQISKAVDMPGLNSGQKARRQEWGEGGGEGRGLRLEARMHRAGCPGPASGAIVFRAACRRTTAGGGVCCRGRRPERCSGRRRRRQPCSPRTLPGVRGLTPVLRPEQVGLVELRTLLVWLLLQLNITTRDQVRAAGRGKGRGGAGAPRSGREG